MLSKNVTQPEAYSCLILAQDLLEKYLSKIGYLTLVAKCDNALQAAEIMKTTEVDLILLDIQMPDLSGLEFLKTLNNPPQVIFTTAYSEYALESYSLDVVDYLLKPIDFARFFKSIEKVANNLKTEFSEPKLIETSGQKDYLVVKSDGAVVKLFFHEILYLESLREYVRFHTQDRKYMVLSSLKSVIEQLPDDFIRVHKSYVAPFGKIKSVSGNVVKLNNGAELPIGKTYKSELMDRF